MKLLQTIAGCGTVLLALLAVQSARAADPEQVEFFEKHVRPVLVERCYDCHGAGEVEGGLRLTSRDALLIGGYSGPAAVEGKPDESLLIEAVRHDGLEMPPDRKLPEQQVDVLRQWIAMGLPWPENKGAPAAPIKQSPGGLSDAWEKRLAEGRKHWAFQPVQQSQPPAVQQADWPNNEIDQFILAALEAKGLKPSPAADRRTLLRRVTFDLTGLPPTPEEVARFVKDPAPDAWQKVVDRLLASPRYGERWARHWLDVARYADTKGYVLLEDSDYPWAYTYRDYVIRSLNEDLPYDQFVLHQLAADKLPLKDPRPLAAMGFLTLGSAFNGNTHDVIDDRIDVVTRGLMGLTVSCARCHDHKFDPIPTRDYYSLYGVMASSVEPLVPPLLAAPPETEEYRTFAQELAAREQKLTDYVTKKYDELERSSRERCAEYLLAAHDLRDKPPTSDFMFITQGGDLNPTVVVRWQAYLERSRRTREPVFALWHALASLPEADFAHEAPAVIHSFTAPEMADRASPLVLAALVRQPPKTLAELAAAYAEVLQAVDAKWQQQLAASGGDAKTSSPLDPAEKALWQVFYGQNAPGRLRRTPTGDLALVPDRKSQDERRKLLQAVEEWLAEGTGAPPRAMSLEDRPVPHEPRVFGRGNPSNLGEPVPRQFLHILSPDGPQPFTEGSGRLELAQAIVDPNNPLTARVIVNRIWQHHFGEGIVRTPSNFGLQGEPPTHPELLDYLAARFVEQGWSLKKLHRQILLSATYQQASRDRSDCRLADPENRLLWKFPRQRLDFESMRDALLAVAGRLDDTLYGPPNEKMVNPQASRRTIYYKIDRLNPPGLLRTFDFPSPDVSTAERSLTTVPPQSLFFMNHPLLHALAERLIARPDVAAESEIAARVDRLYRLLFARPPAAEETATARDFLGESPTADDWTQYAQGLLMTNEFVFLD